MSLDKNIVNKICERLVEAYQPEAIYLFGSYAWGNPQPDSDIDLLVIVKDDALEENKKGLKGQYALADLILPKDLLVTTKSNFSQRATHPSTLYYKINKEAIKIYAAA